MAFVAGMAAFFVSCDKGFEEMNTNPNAVTEPVIESMFSTNILRTSGTDFESHRTNLIYAGAMIQHFASTTTYWSGDKYLFNDQYSGAFYVRAYPDQVKEIEQIIAEVQDNPEQINHYAITRIWRVFIYHRITDLYGDVPYSEAGKGYINQVYSPKYDKQSEIYPDMLQELEEAALALDATKASFGAADFIYNGDTAKWKKFAYSLMLRLGMRLTKVDPALAESYVKKAIAGGVMQSNDDLAKVPHTDGPEDINRNMVGRQLITQEIDAANLKGKANSKLSKTLVDFLKNNNDPRLPVIATLWQGNADESKLATSTAPALQKGLPNGYDATSIRTLIPTWGVTDSLPLYSEPNIHTVASSEAPTILQSYAEVELLLAEAALRGWESGSVVDHYNKGVTAAIQHMNLYPGVTIDAAATTAYLTAHPFVGGSMEQQMEQIHTQYWVATFLNSYEGYANWRRTGYPALTPTNYPGNETGGVIPRRLIYPQSEASVNSTQYNAAVQQQGPDLFLTRVWWDKQ
ncbi:SusD/RagB family nutrient-binding outer membrane lipoprotein [Rhodocytophaga aerolata]|uniref:SusD/RagB family nutrient-binding outer membrane lipoprotein n=1 Tax=Rhodocytophaga aerolata TaxID=455078 RepID=A0ABT8RA71_9BACT|nr:SusD/RagB family nutrient-binding outer membrane lipoprotein [Rhodocytophaga aerolata]MDO1448571.1 SusD/RagB family nutrient-binding outer membrane lipoprotein [Rhodocytophaga aerolata]